MPEAELDERFASSYGIFSGCGNKTVVLRFSRKLVMDILRRGAEVEVSGLDSLRGAVGEALQRAAARYRQA